LGLCVFKLGRFVLQDPVTAGDARDKYDQFKGLGMDMNDPFDTFRKNRSQGYVSRLKGRDGEFWVH